MLRSAIVIAGAGCLVSAAVAALAWPVPPPISHMRTTLGRVEFSTDDGRTWHYYFVADHAGHGGVSRGRRPTADSSLIYIVYAPTDPSRWNFTAGGDAPEVNRLYASWREERLGLRTRVSAALLLAGLACFAVRAFHVMPKEKGRPRWDAPSTGVDRR